MHFLNDKETIFIISKIINLIMLLDWHQSSCVSVQKKEKKGFSVLIQCFVVFKIWCDWSDGDAVITGFKGPELKGSLLHLVPNWSMWCLHHSWGTACFSLPCSDTAPLKHSALLLNLNTRKPFPWCDCAHEQIWVCTTCTLAASITLATY